MGKKLFVGNLPFSITEGELGDLFAQVGAVESVRLITDRDTGRKKGFGFVEMAGDKEADDAIARFNGAQLNGRPLVVNEARPPEKREGGGGGYRGGNGGGGGGGGGGYRGGNGGGGGYGDNG